MITGSVRTTARLRRAGQDPTAAVDLMEQAAREEAGLT